METKFGNFKYAFVKKQNNLKGCYVAYLSNKLKSIYNANNSIAFISYDFKNEIEKFELKQNNRLTFPDTLFCDIEKKIELNDLDELSTHFKKTQKIQLQETVSKTDYVKTVNQLKEDIQRGDIYEINYCITFEAQNVEINPVEVFQKLTAISNAPYSCLAKFNNCYIISASPELFITKKDSKLITKPIKGTAKRGVSDTEDEELKQNLKQSLKEQTENVMIVDVCRNDLSRIAKKGTVVVEKLFDIETYKQVHQMVSTVSCQVKDNMSFSDIMNATFPMASMTGAPKIKAMELIDKYERYNRNAYSGTIGIIDDNGDFTLSVLIRSIFYDTDKKYLSFSVGSAITSMCNAEDEYEECLLKAKAMVQVLME